MKTLPDEIRQLSPLDRLQLIEDVWESILDDEAVLHQLHEKEKADLFRRLSYLASYFGRIRYILEMGEEFDRFQRNSIIIAFRREFMRQIRDKAISNLDDHLSGKYKSLLMWEFIELIDRFPPEFREIFTSKLMPFCVDVGLLWALIYFENSNLFRITTYFDGKSLNLKDISDRLSGEFDSGIEYSQERYLESYYNFFKT